MTPTARTLQALREEGWLPAVVEKWNPGARARQDLYGCIDIVAIRGDQPGVLGVQATTVAHQAHRLEKIAGLTTVPIWLAAGNRLEVWGWAKRGARGKVKRWEVTRTVVPVVPSPQGEGE